MLRFFSVAVLLGLGASVVYAQNLSAIKQRQDAMAAVFRAGKEPNAMAKGDANFDLAKVQAALKVYEEQAKAVLSLYPDDSKTGGNTAALPAIWQNKKEFLAGYEKLAVDAAAAAKTIKDDASFKAEWKKVNSNCFACHKNYVDVDAVVAKMRKL